MRALFSLLLVIAALPDDLARELRSKDPLVRLDAARALEEGAEADEDAAKLLIRALGDDDWEVVEIAARTLGSRGGERNSEHAIPP